MRKNKEIVMFSTPFVGVRGGKNRESQVIIKSAYPQVYSAGHSLVRKLLPQILNKQSTSENRARHQVSPLEQLTMPQPLPPQHAVHKISPRGGTTYLHPLKTHRRGHLSKAQSAKHRMAFVQGVTRLKRLPETWVSTNFIYEHG